MKQEIFKNETKISKKEYKMFINAHQKQFGKKESMKNLAYCIFFIIFIIFAIVNKVYILAIFIFLILIVYYIAEVIYPNKKVQKEMKSKKIKKEYQNLYKFYNYSFTIKNNKDITRIFYWKIDKILENDTHFYIYLTKRRAFPISKKGFTKGKGEDFAKFIKKRLFFKYKKENT